MIALCLEQFSIKCQVVFALLFALGLLYCALWLVKKARATFPNQSTNRHLLARVFPRLTLITANYMYLLRLIIGPFCVGGDRGAGDREKRGREVYGRREKRGREAGFPRWREAGEKGKNYATLRNISQSKKCKGAGAKKYRAGTGIKGYGKREV